MSGVYSSIDQGKTWSAPPGDFPAGFVTDLTAYNGQVAASLLPGKPPFANNTAKVLLTSSNGGRSWSPTDVACDTGGAAPPPVSVDAVHFGPGGELFVGGPDGLYQARRGDARWRWTLIPPLGHVVRLAQAGDELLFIVRPDISGARSELYRRQAGRQPERIGAWDEGASSVAAMPDRTAAAAAFVLMESLTVQTVAGGLQSSIGRGPSHETFILVIAAGERRRQLLLAHDGGVARYRQLFDSGG